MSSVAESIALAAPSFMGQLLRPTDHGYDEVRRVHNGLIDKYPAIVARCHGVADVVDAVQMARTLGLEVSVRGGGHNVAGRATIDQGLIARNYWKAQFLTDLSDDAIRTLIAGFEECPSPMSHIIIEHFHGAASRVPVTATACPMRVTGFNVIIASQWTGAGETERGMKWARETFASLTPYLAATRYLNYLEDDAPSPAAVAYGPNLPRLRGLKTKYDPTNFFRHNVNILPK